jgi:hypothetical protein
MKKQTPNEKQRFRVQRFRVQRFRVVGSVFLLLFFSFHSKFDVGRSMFDVHLLIRSMFIFFSSFWAKTT